MPTFNSGESPPRWRAAVVDAESLLDAHAERQWIPLTDSVVGQTDVIPDLIRLGQSVDLTDAIAFAQRHFSNTPSASDAFAQAAVRTATWAKEQVLPPPRVLLRRFGVLSLWRVCSNSLEHLFPDLRVLAPSPAVGS